MAVWKAVEGNEMAGLSHREGDIQADGAFRPQGKLKGIKVIYNHKTNANGDILKY